MAPVLRALGDGYPALQTRVAFTGQHTSLVDRVMGAFDIAPDYDLAIMKPDQTLYDVLGRASRGLAGVIRDFQPDMLLTQASPPPATLTR